MWLFLFGFFFFIFFKQPPVYKMAQENSGVLRMEMEIFSSTQVDKQRRYVIFRRQKRAQKVTC